MYNTPYVVTFKQFISYTIINWWIDEFLVGNIVNFDYSKTHSWLNPKFFDYMMNNFSRGSEHM